MRPSFTLSRWVPGLSISMLRTVGASISPPLVFADPDGDPAAIGEQFFVETRFAQSFKNFLTANGMNVNELETHGDESVDFAINWRRTNSQQEPEPNEFTSMNCSSCQLVDVHLDTPDYGMRTYADFARRSPVPDRGDGKHFTVRNSPALVNASLEREIGFFLHFDGEFTTMQDLVEATLTGRNYGYLPTEAAAAIAHIAKVLRNDDGTHLDPEILGKKEDASTPSYRELLTGMYAGGAPDDEFRLPAEFRVPEAYFDNHNAENDKRLFEAASRLIAAYTADLAFEQISPYDAFLEMNNLPTGPENGQSAIQYSRRLLRKIMELEQDGLLWFVSANPNTNNGKFQFHDQDFQFGPDQPFFFGPEELKGLKTFLNESRRVQRAVGNCIACHAAPHFTDFKFNNTGIAQNEYDGIHGKGAFMKLHNPGLPKRNRNHNKYLPATERHPNAQEPFRSIPQANNKYLTDLGVWNIFGNPDFPLSQETLTKIVCESQRKNKPINLKRFPHACDQKRLLRQTIGLFKTPGLRDLDHSPPFTHPGEADELEDVIQQYIDNSELARAHQLRNGAIGMREIRLQASDIAPLKAFLKSLNEDYE